MNAITIGIDLAKSVFQVHGVDAAGAEAICWCASARCRAMPSADIVPSLGSSLRKAPVGQLNLSSGCARPTGLYFRTWPAPPYEDSLINLLHWPSRSTGLSGVCWPSTAKTRPASGWQPYPGLGLSPPRLCRPPSPIPAPSAPAASLPLFWG
jgi:hypothetical protein